MPSHGQGRKEETDRVYWALLLAGRQRAEHKVDGRVGLFDGGKIYTTTQIVLAKRRPTRQ